MGENRLTKPIGLVFIITAHMVLYGSSHADVTAFIGQDISLHFSFNTTISKNSTFGIYKTQEKKISEYPRHKEKFEIYPVNSSICFHIKNLSLDDASIYWATLFLDSFPALSNKVNLTVKEDDRSTTDPPVLCTFTKTTTDGSSSFFSSRVVTVVALSPLLLFAALLLFMVICFAKPKAQTQDASRRTSNPTMQETVEVSVTTPEPSLVYSVLDFPKRPPSAMEIAPNDTEYATVSYLPEKKPRPHKNK
ncbi:PREDICTED: uncharacterized protein LOC107103345 [Cyprinodon variegatus]|uniref:uncharacterized protein LOC107099667 n=1 Tax=Cyprinodon variegatus TaxID=28743 RepID=UPI00074284A4|nr:PREDICTED: uncharacterized protein LOC107099667 [Cyprinodon variegatus]XP_015258504.1 PREDICTED: uncharacterized protein LOC107103345 [Cyprinodon variegatus]